MKKIIILLMLIISSTLLTGCELFGMFRVLKADLEDVKVFTIEDEEIIGQWAQDYDVEDYFYEQDLSFKYIYQMNSPRPIYEYYQIDSATPISVQIEFQLRINEKYVFESIQLTTGRTNQTVIYKLDDLGVTYTIDGRKVNVRITTNEFSSSDVLTIDQIKCLEVETDDPIYAGLNNSSRPGSILGVFIKIEQ